MIHEHVVRRRLSRIGGLALLAALAGCVSERVSEAPVGPPNTTVYFYPAQGQSSEQQDRDKFECYHWSVQQSGFDPSSPNTPPHLRTVVAMAPPPGAGVAVGAMTGAVVGASVSRPWEAGPGALIGAIAGAAIGGAAETSAREQAAANANNARAAVIEQQASNYRRAMSACLEGRGYKVQ